MKWGWMTAKWVWDETTKIGQFRSCHSWTWFMTYHWLWLWSTRHRKSVRWMTSSLWQLVTYPWRSDIICDVARPSLVVCFLYARHISRHLIEYCIARFLITNMFDNFSFAIHHMFYRCVCHSFGEWPPTALIHPSRASSAASALHQSVLCDLKHFVGLFARSMQLQQATTAIYLFLHPAVERRTPVHSAHQCMHTWVVHAFMLHCTRCSLSSNKAAVNIIAFLASSTRSGPSLTTTTTSDNPPLLSHQATCMHAWCMAL